MFPKDRAYRPYFRQNSAPVRKYTRHLQDASMLAELYKDDVII